MRALTWILLAQAQEFPAVSSMKAFCVKADNAALIAGSIKLVECRKYCIKVGEYALVCVHNKPNPYAAAEYDA